MKLKSVKHTIVMFLVNNLFAGAYLFEVKRRLLNSIGYSLGEGTKVVGPVFCTGQLKTGCNCWLGRNFTIHGTGTVEIGDHCDIAPDVTFLTGRQESPEENAGESRNYSIFVEEGCWIGAGCTVVRNVSIGKGSMVTAGSCVMRNMQDNILLGGVPARLIKKLDEV